MVGDLADKGTLEATLTYVMPLLLEDDEVLTSMLFCALK